MNNMSEISDDRVKAFRDIIDAMIVNIYELPHDKKTQLCMTLGKILTSKYANVAIGISMEDIDTIQINIRGNMDNVRRIKHLKEQRDRIDAELLEFENPIKYK